MLNLVLVKLEKESSRQRTSNIRYTTGDVGRVGRRQTALLSRLPVFLRAGINILIAGISRSWNAKCREKYFTNRAIGLFVVRVLKCSRL